MLAGAYGWSKTQILETVYFDELPEYARAIRRRQARGNLDRLDIALAAEGKPEFKKALYQHYMKAAEAQHDTRHQKLDRAGLQGLKHRLNNKQGLKVVKK